jgi:hypothetical protein
LRRRDMAGLEVNVQLLREFEKGLDPRFPERSAIPVRVLGYGEISTVLEIGTESDRDLAYKRMSMFRTEQEAKDYEALYEEYIKVLQDRIGVQVVPSDLIRLVDNDRDRVVVYIVQQKLPSGTIGHKAIHHISPSEIRRLVLAVLAEMKKVFDFNREHCGELEVGFDGQISNWAIANLDPETPALDEEVELVYFDTSAPFVRKDGEEQLDAELFLRSAPSFLVWILRLLFLEDVMTRYYDFRQVTIDLLANLYKEQRPDLVPDLVDTVNGFFAAEIQEGGFEPFSVKEIQAYYREDAWIWRFYLAFRRVDRYLHRLLGKDYPYVLPGKIKR